MEKGIDGYKYREEEMTVKLSDLEAM